MEERISRPQGAGDGNRIVGFFVELAERYLPDAFLFAVVLTLITFVMAGLLVTPNITEVYGRY